MEKTSTLLSLLVLFGVVKVLETVPLSNEVYRLPDDVIPKRYLLEIQADLNNNTFNGSVAIEVEVLRSTKCVTLHKKQLKIDHNSVSVLESDGSQVKVTNLTEGRINEIFSVHTQDELQVGRSYVLIIGSFQGVTTGPYGFYASTYIDEEGAKKTFAIADFEPIYARKAFPCFDEPQLKAKFQIYIIRPENYISVSNAKLESSVRLDNGMYKDIYKETPSMSTYGVAFAITDFAVSALENLKVYGRPEMVKRHGYELALRTSKEVLELMENFTGISYMLDKLDFINEPSKNFFTERSDNWGAITYSESLLFCTNSSTDVKIQEITNNVAHGLIRQWFGNLVSPRWWTSMWLNEGSARFIQPYVMSMIRPSWRLMEQYVVTRFYSAMTNDASIHFDDFNEETYIKYGIRSEIMYNKGSAILYMLRNFLTKSVFDEGLRDYLNTHKFSTADSSDLFHAMQQAAVRSNKIKHLGNMTVEQLMQDWINKSGVLLITVNRNYATDSVSFSQTTLFNKRNVDEEEIEEVEEETILNVPVNYAFQSDSPEKFKTTVPDFWLSEKNSTLSTIVDETKRDDWLLVNIQQSSMYRVNYDDENWKRLIAHMRSDRFEDIPVLNRAQLLNDAFQLAKKKIVPFSIPMKLSTYLTRERDIFPIYVFLHFCKYAVKGHIEELFMKRKVEEMKQFWPEFSAAYVEPEEFAAAEAAMKFFLKLFKPIYQELGVRERITDTPMEKLTRSMVLNLICHSIFECRSALLREFERIKVTGNVNIVGRSLQYIVFCEAATQESGKRYLQQLYVQNQDYVVRARINEALKCH